MRKVKIIRNAIKCKNCGEILESNSRHDWVCCQCFKESNGQCGVYCDGGLDYLRRGGDPRDYIELAETRPLTEEEIKEREDRLLEEYKNLGYNFSEILRGIKDARMGTETGRDSEKD